ncbi:lipoprotein [Streptomyces durmitorensis]
MVRSSRTLAAAVAGAALVALAGCGGDDSDDKGGPFAGKSADQIAADAVKATQQADSMHMKGTVQQSAGSSMTIDLSVDQSKNCDGTIETAGASADVRNTKGTFYLRGDEKYWETALKGQPGGDKIVPKVADKWVKAPADDATAKNVCDKKALTAAMDKDKSERKGMKKGSTTTVDGSEAIRLTKKTSGGETLTLYVATEGKPYILRTTSTGGKEPNTATFSDYGKSVSPEEPAPGETVDLQKLAASGEKA